MTTQVFVGMASACQEKIARTVQKTAGRVMGVPTELARPMRPAHRARRTAGPVTPVVMDSVSNRKRAGRVRQIVGSVSLAEMELVMQQKKTASPVQGIVVRVNRVVTASVNQPRHARRANWIVARALPVRTVNAWPMKRV